MFLIPAIVPTADQIAAITGRATMAHSVNVPDNHRVIEQKSMVFSVRKIAFAISAPVRKRFGFTREKFTSVAKRKKDLTPESDKSFIHK